MIKLILNFILFLWISQIAVSQPEPVQTIFDKYMREKGFSSMILREPTPFYASNSLMSLTIDGIQLMKVVKYNFNDSVDNKGKEFIGSLKKITDLKGFEKNMHIIEESNEVFMLIKRVGDEVKEVILGAINENDNSILMWFEGSLRISSVTRYSVNNLRQYFGKGNKRREFNVAPWMHHFLPEFHPFFYDFDNQKPKEKDESESNEE